MDKTTFTRLVREFKFKELFNQMGWDNASGSFQIELKGNTFTISVICEKSGFRFLQCTPPAGSVIPSKNDRLSIQSIVKRRYYEHLLIFTDDQKQKQIWQYAYKPAGKPIKTVITEYYVTQDPQLLFQRTKGLVFSIDEHENITLVDVTKRMNASVDQNSEKVTKKFYDGFKKQHTKFLSFMTGISDEIDKNWYTSVMLNRLMFCYFIQKRGFLDNDVHYLMNKLQDGQLVHGRDKFYSFYRSFLLQLFHNGLGSPDRDNLSDEFGKIPYLNGGIFSVHELESKYEGQIQISDDAFESLFKFFEEFNWHLDTNITATGRDINPDVIGYIFEKYINDRAQMGAYYTKEDITDYIGKNTILPYLFDEVQRKLPEAFKPEGEIWQKLKSSDDLYIYNAVKYGLNPEDVWYDLPDDIRAGIDPEQENLIELRRCWNRTAPAEVALPTEIWREVIARRQRYIEVKQYIQSGNIAQINDFITYNLDIRQFVLDLINETDDPKLVFQFYNALKSVTILDPTCGSGAFLFAAMNILEDLYEACINRMRDFVTDNPGHSTSHLKKELELVDSPSHPNLEYFIYKSIILNNLYGVDIMNEAVEIAKLRLFLKLVACVDPNLNHPNYGLEPLPDIDFNIRCGNTLVGYATWKEIEKDIESDVISAAENKGIIPEMCQEVALAFVRYKDIQLEGYPDYQNFMVAKKELMKNLKDLTDHLDHMLYQHSNSLSFSKWKDRHQPFHWFAEFYEIVHDNEGFDVVIGNPPYVNLNKVQYNLASCDYKCLSCGDLFPLIMEKSYQICNSQGKNGYIIPLSCMSTDTMIPIRDFLFDNSGESWNSYFSASDQPASLFNGVRHRLLVTLNSLNKKHDDRFSTRFIKWFSIEREHLFHSKILYCKVGNEVPKHIKISSKLEKSIVVKLKSDKALGLYITKQGTPFYFHNAPVHWGKVFDFIPYYAVNGSQQRSSHIRQLYMRYREDTSTVISLLNSSLFYWYNWLFSNCRDLSNKNVYAFPITMTELSSDIRSNLCSLKDRLMEDYQKNRRIYKRVTSDNQTEFDSFYPMLSKSIIDEIDSELAKHYSLNEEELEYIINYDIKYRMGSNLNDGDDDE